MGGRREALSWGMQVRNSGTLGMQERNFGLGCRRGVLELWDAGEHLWAGMQEGNSGWDAEEFWSSGMQERRVNGLWDAGRDLWAGMQSPGAGASPGSPPAPPSSPAGITHAFAAPSHVAGIQAGGALFPLEISDKTPPLPLFLGPDRMWVWGRGRGSPPSCPTAAQLLLPAFPWRWGLSGSPAPSRGWDFSWLEQQPLKDGKLEQLEALKTLFPFLMFRTFISVAEGAEERKDV